MSESVNKPTESARWYGQLPFVIALRMGLTLTVLLIMAWAIPVSNDFRGLARPMPLLVACAGVAFATLSLLLDGWKLTRRRQVIAGDELVTATLHEGEHGVTDTLKRVGAVIAWFLGFLALIAAIGVFAGSILWVAAFGFYFADWSVLRSVVSGVSAGAGLLILRTLLDLQWPAAIWDLGGLL
jgi:hypothetical protein